MCCLLVLNSVTSTPHRWMSEPPCARRQGVPHGQTELSGGIVLAVICWARAPRGGVTRQGVVLTDLQSLLDSRQTSHFLIVKKNENPTHNTPFPRVHRTSIVNTHSLLYTRFTYSRSYCTVKYLSHIHSMQGLPKETSHTPRP